MTLAPGPLRPVLILQSDWNDLEEIILYGEKVLQPMSHCSQQFGKVGKEMASLAECCFCTIPHTFSLKYRTWKQKVNDSHSMSCRLGNERWLNVLPWSNVTAFTNAKDEDWLVDNKVAGTVRAVHKLSFVKISDAGHMSPMDQPQNTLDMITRFVQKKELVSNKNEFNAPKLTQSDIEGAYDTIVKMRPSHAVTQS